jgi:uncharacterized protein YndB with AHSA1/START domain
LRHFLTFEGLGFFQRENAGWNPVKITLWLKIFTALSGLGGLLRGEGGRNTTNPFFHRILMSSSDSPADNPASLANRELVFTRILNAPREKVYRAWTDPELLKQWFAPKPWSTPLAQLEVRPGGANLIVMRGPDGNEFPNRGVYLEVVPNERLVFTDAYVKAWEPSAKPFMTVTLTFEDAGEGKTKYTARVLHWSVADRDAHEKMGFHQGWGQCATQLDELVSRR